jgi:microcystin degradation protein MlrC
LPLDEAVEAALAARGKHGPVILADSSDNPGGGAACDSTFVLRALFDRNIGNVAFGMVWDPQAAQIAASAGVGARIPLRVGGKVGPQSGQPVDLDVEVLAVRTDAVQADIGSDGSDPLGLAVAVRAAGIDIVINSIRQQTYSPDCFTQLGIEPANKDIVVVKSSQHFRAGFDRFGGPSIYCNAPGSLNLDLGALPYRHIRRPIWPLDNVESAFATSGDPA